MVTRCVCFNKSFSELKKIARRTGADTVEELQIHARFGHNCMMCHPYVRRMLKTGLTEFHVFEDDEA
jgi:bacterioferritin-associated ferredoxin